MTKTTERRWWRWRWWPATSSCSSWNDGTSPCPLVVAYMRRPKVCSYIVAYSYTTHADHLLLTAWRWSGPLHPPAQ